MGGPKRGRRLDAAIPGPYGLRPAFAPALADGLRFAVLALLDPRTVAIFPGRAIAHGRRMPIVGYMSSSGSDFSGNIIDGYGWSSAEPGIAAKMVAYLGAGIYEELLFRLILLSATVWLIRRWWTAQNLSMVLAVLVSSLIFATAHYVGHAGDVFQWFSFLFRFMAGVFFSILFIYRGFGIAAGSHAAYDILAILFLKSY